MTESKQYKLTLEVDDDADIDGIEDALQEVLLDLYEQGDVEGITVTKNGHTDDNIDEGVAEMLNIVERVDSSDIRKAIDTIKKLEQLGGENNG